MNRLSVRYTIKYIDYVGKTGCHEVKTKGAMQLIARKRAFGGCKVWAVKKVQVSEIGWVVVEDYSHEELVGVPYRKMGRCN